MALSDSRNLPLVPGAASVAVDSDQVPKRVPSVPSDRAESRPMPRFFGADHLIAPLCWSDHLVRVVVVMRVRVGLAVRLVLVSVLVWVLVLVWVSVGVGSLTLDLALSLP